MRYVVKPTTSVIVPTFYLSIIPVNSAPIWELKYKCGYIDMEFIEEIVKNGERSEFKAKPFWSLNGKLEKDELSRQIEVFKKMGFGGAFLHSRTGLKTEYMGEEWLDDLEFCVEELEKRGMESWLYDEDRWPSGTCGGTVAKKKANRLKSIVCDISDCSDGKNFVKPKRFIALFSVLFDGDRLVSYKRVNSAEEIVKGEKAVCFYWAYMLPSDFYNGYTYIDTLNKNAVKDFLKSTHEVYKEKFGEKFGKEIKGIFQDEVNRGPLFNGFVLGDKDCLKKVPYTYRLFEEFKKIKKYDLKERLPELYFRYLGENFSKVAYDFVDVLMQMLLANFTVPYGKWCKDNGLIVTGHVLHEDALSCQTTMMGSVMQYYRYMDYPGIDNLGSCNYCYEVPKLAASVAKQFGKKFVLSEMYGVSGWRMSLNDYKHDGDWQAFMGITFRCPHLSWYTMKGEAKRDCPASIMSQSGWYTEYKAVEDYFSRLDAVFSCCDEMTENLIIHPVESAWGLSRYGGYVDYFGVTDDEYKRLEKNYKDLFGMIQKCGLDADYGDEGLIAESGRAENGLLYVGEKGYKRVVVSGLVTIRSSTLALLNEFEEQGGEVVFVSEFSRFIDGIKVTDDRFSGRKILPLNEKILFDKLKETEFPVRVSPLGCGVFVRRLKTDKGYVAAFLNSDKKAGITVKITVPTKRNIAKYNPRNGRVEPLNFIKTDECVTFEYSFAGGEELLVFETDSLYVAEEKAKKKEVTIERKEFDYSLGEDNFLLLDNASLYCNGTWDERGYVLGKDDKLRRKYGLSLRSGEMIQPWFKEKFDKENYNRKYGVHALKFEFLLETTEIGEIFLVAETDIEKAETFINGEKFNGKWEKGDIDNCFLKSAIDSKTFKPGLNEIVIKFDFEEKIDLEAIYLQGKFGVKRGKTDSVVKLPEKLGIGDIADAGMPYYTGTVEYVIEVPKGVYDVCFDEIGGAAAVRVNGILVAFAPFIATDIKSDGKLKIEYVFGRNNLFGTHVGDNNSTGKSFVAQGMKKLPKIYLKETKEI